MCKAQKYTTFASLGFAVALFHLFCPSASGSFLLPLQAKKFSPLYESLSHLTSSTERYAASLGLTIAQLDAIKTSRAATSLALHTALQGKHLTGPQKHTLLCQHVMDHGQHPFVCRNCWTYTPICICPSSTTTRFDIPVHQVVLWTHHEEWGAVSNTGSVLPLLLKNVHIKLKGLPDHDAWFENLLQDSNVLPIVLWPDNSQATPAATAANTANTATTTTTELDYQHHYHSAQDLLQLQYNSTQKKKIVLIAMEGSWRHARRMVSKLPTIDRLALTPNQIFGWRQQNAKATIRKQSHDASPQHACTAEAIVGALVALGFHTSHGDAVLQLAEQKMNRTKRYQGHDWKLL